MIKALPNVHSNTFQRSGRFPTEPLEGCNTCRWQLLSHDCLILTGEGVGVVMNVRMIYKSSIFNRYLSELISLA